jgi:hypothetical protein
VIGIAFSCVDSRMTGPYIALRACGQAVNANVDAGTSLIPIDGGLAFVVSFHSARLTVCLWRHVGHVPALRQMAGAGR